ncbi:MAG: signal peptidase I [Desulfobacteraceae bacterium]|nr:MAG: signal peptidase I [Desulfobacteraceae bacterium]
MGSQFKQRLHKFFQGWTGSIIVAFLIAMTFKSLIADWNDVPSGSMKPTIVEGDRIFVNKLAYDLKVPFWPFGIPPYKTIQLIRWDDPKRGDIVVFFSPTQGTRLVKRVVGLPGDTVKLENNLLSINNKTLAYQNAPSSLYGDLSAMEKSVHDFYMENMGTKTHMMMIKNFGKTLQFCSQIKSEKELNEMYPLESDQNKVRKICSPSNGSEISFLFVVPNNSYIMIGDNRTDSADSRVFQYVDRRHIVGRAVAIVFSREGSIFKGRFRVHRFFKKLI